MPVEKPSKQHSYKNFKPIIMNIQNDKTQVLISSMGKINLYSKKDIACIKQASKIAAQTLDHISKYVQAGISTKELDSICQDFILSHGARPACLGYQGYPASICTSVNHIVCHGIPKATEFLKNGDIVNIDLVVELNGWHGDTSRMFTVGKISPEALGLINVTKDALMQGINAVTPGGYLKDIGQAITDCIEPNGFSIVQDYAGHGIGKKMHESPEILHYINNSNIMIRPGMCFTIEPMINIGMPGTKTLNDNWTVVTQDKSLSAQWEHTIVVTDSGYEILTL